MKDLLLSFMKERDGRLELSPPFDVIIENGNIKLGRDEVAVTQATLLTLVREKNTNALVPELGSELSSRIGEKLTRAELDRMAREVRRALGLVAGIDFGDLSVTEVVRGKVYLSEQEGAVLVDVTLKTKGRRVLEMSLKL